MTLQLSVIVSGSDGDAVVTQTSLSLSPLEGRPPSPADLVRASCLVMEMPICICSCRSQSSLQGAWYIWYLINTLGSQTGSEAVGQGQNSPWELVGWRQRIWQFIIVCKLNVLPQWPSPKHTPSCVAPWVQLPLCVACLRISTTDSLSLREKQ